jgi:2-amino-4-hydroxy-6-hydroxymethyldihydropteridine diphosphokinase
MVVTGAIGEPPAKLLRLLKDLERAAGRRVAADRVAGRPLDIDIIDYRGHRSLRPAPRGRRRPGQVILPHPEAHRRAFVLAPLAQVAGYGLSSTFGGGVRHLLVKQRAPRHALRRLDSSAVV